MSSVQGMSSPLAINSLDHVALWVADRDAARGLPLRAPRDARRSSARTTFTLVGADARRGKLTLFDGRGPARARRAGARSCCACATSTRALAALPERARGRARRRRRRASRRPEGLGSALIERETDLDYDLDHVVLRGPRPRRGAQALGGARLRRRDGRAARSATRELRARAPAARREGERPLLNHLALLVDSGRGAAATRRATGASRSPRSSTPRTRSPSSCGARTRIQLEYVEHKPELLAGRRRVPDLVVAGAGMAGLAAAAAGARARRRRASLLEKGDRAGRLDAAVERGRLAPPRASSDFRARVPGGDAALQRARVRAPRRRPRLARVARRAGARARHRQPADDRGAASTPRRSPMRSCAAGGRVRLRRAAARAAGRRAGGARDRRLRRPIADAACASTSRPRPTSCCCARRPWSTGDGLRLGLAAGGRAERRHGRVLRAQHARAARARSSEAGFVPPAQLYAPHATVTQRARASATRPARGRRSTSCSGPRASRARAPGYAVAPTSARRARCATARSREMIDARARRPARRSSARATVHGRSRPWPASPRRSAACAIDARGRAAPTACSRRAPTPAGSRPAATPAALQRARARAASPRRAALARG